MGTLSRQSAHRQHRQQRRSVPSVERPFVSSPQECRRQRGKRGAASVRGLAQLATLPPGRRRCRRAYRCNAGRDDLSKYRRSDTLSRGSPRAAGAPPTRGPNPISLILRCAASQLCRAIKIHDLATRAVLPDRPWVRIGPRIRGECNSFAGGHGRPALARDAPSMTTPSTREPTIGLGAHAQRMHSLSDTYDPVCTLANPVMTTRSPPPGAQYTRHLCGTNDEGPRSRRTARETTAPQVAG